MKRCLCSATILFFTVFLPLRLLAQGYVISSIQPGNFSAFTNCGTHPLAVNFYADFAPAGDPAQMDLVLNGTGFTPSVFLVLISWGDGTTSTDTAYINSQGTAALFSQNQSPQHYYAAPGQYTVTLQITNLLTNLSTPYTFVYTVLSGCQTDIYLAVNLDCNNDGISDSTLYSGVPVTLTPPGQQWSGILSTLSNGIVYFAPDVTGTHTLAIDPAWLQANGYYVLSYTPSDQVFITGSPNAPQTIQVTLGCTNASNSCVSALVFCDANHNGLFDGSEQVLPGAPVQLHYAGNAYSTNPSNGNGQVTFTLPTPAPGSPLLLCVDSNYLAASGYSMSNNCFPVQATPCLAGNPVLLPVICDTLPQTCAFGYVYCDLNQNGVFDGGDTPHNGAPVTLDLGNGTTVTVYTNNGLFSYTGPGPAVLQATLDANWLSQHGFMLSGNATVTTNCNAQVFGQFPLDCGPGFNCADLWTTVTPWIGYYQGQTAYISLNWGNNGPAVPGNYTLSFSFPPGVTVNTSSISIPGYTLSGNTITWNLSSNFASFYNSDIITFNVPSGMLNGANHFYTSAISAQNDCNTANNNGNLLQVLGNSYDPNDKNVNSPQAIDPAVQDELTYVIRFQNTGTAPAQNIYITDTLSPNLDLSTFQLLESSHSVQIQQPGNGVYRFEFPQIWLPDSNTNEPMSHGHLVYKAKEKASNPTGSEIRNTAYIYFDWNPPIITNTTYNVNLGSGLGTAGETTIQLYPVPVHSMLNIQSGDAAIQRIHITDISGKTVLLKNTTGHMQSLHLEHLPQGIYLLRIETEKGEIFRKIIRQ
ncbi:MAG: DUF7619 domain-containing protein [Flavobacteriales bacterium]